MDQVIGGYNPISWKSRGGWTKAKGAFLFSYNKNFISELKDPNNQRAVHLKELIFGLNGDLYIKNNANAQKDS